MSTLTVSGAGNTVLTVSLDGTTNYQLAQQFAALVNTAAGAGTLSASIVSSTAGPAAVPPGFLGEAEVVAPLSNLAWPAADTVMLDVAAGATTVSATLIATPVSILAGSGGTTFDAGAGQTTFIAGGGSNTYNGYVAPGGVTTLPGAGSSTLNMVATGAGNDTITAGTGNFDIDPGTGSNLVVLGTGTSYVNSTGQDMIMGGPAHLTAGVADASTIYLSGTGATVVGGSGLLDILASNGISPPGGGGDTITLGSGGGGITGVANSTFNLAGTASVTAGGSDTINVGGATATVRADTAAGAGPTLVNGPTGTGSLMFIGGTGASTVAGGAVALTVAGALGGSVTFTGAASGNLLMVSGAGGSASLIDASTATGANTFVTGSSAATVLGGSGADLFTIGSAASSLTGGANGVNTYEFQATATGGATDVITDFKATDKLSISGYALNGASVLAGASVGGGSTTITLSDQTKIVLQNFATLTGGNFS